MNKAELIEKVSERVKISSKAAMVIVNTIFDSMRESMEKGERIEIRGFGNFRNHLPLPNKIRRFSEIT